MVNPWIQLATLFGLFAAGGFIGLGLAAWAAPGSGLAAGISGMLLPAAFAGGLLIWSGLDILAAVVDLVRGRARRPSPGLAPHAGRWFVPLALLLNIAGGLIVGLVPGGSGVLTTVIIYAAVGALYGRVVARLAARRYLPGPHLD